MRPLEAGVVLRFTQNEAPGASEGAGDLEGATRRDAGINNCKATGSIRDCKQKCKYERGNTPGTHDTIRYLLHQSWLRYLASFRNLACHRSSDHSGPLPPARHKLDMLHANVYLGGQVPRHVP
jgi:hypothetical protein